jgi:putative intracellular protease/amidase
MAVALPVLEAADHLLGRAAQADDVAAFGDAPLCARRRARTSDANDPYRYDPDTRDHRVACLAFDGLAPFELGVAAEVFALARPELAVARWYEFALCAPEPGPLHVVGGFTVHAPHGLEALARADTVIVPGVPDPREDPPARVLDALRAAHARGARVVSICSGAFALAAAGLLDGLEAATHWRYAALLAERFPSVRVNADVLYLDAGSVLTSAGTAAGIDLCLHLVRRDHGAEAGHERGDRDEGEDLPAPLHFARTVPDHWQNASESGRLRSCPTGPSRARTARSPARSRSSASAGRC